MYIPRQVLAQPRGTVCLDKYIHYAREVYMLRVDILDIDTYLKYVSIDLREDMCRYTICVDIYILHIDTYLSLREIMCRYVRYRHISKICVGILDIDTHLKYVSIDLREDMCRYIIYRHIWGGYDLVSSLKL